MATAGHNVATGENIQNPEEPGLGAEYGYPRDQIKGQGGVANVEVSADVADRFEAAK